METKNKLLRLDCPNCSGKLEYKIVGGSGAGKFFCKSCSYSIRKSRYLIEIGVVKIKGPKVRTWRANTK